jgi:hypothetical protein
MSAKRNLAATQAVRKISRPRLVAARVTMMKRDNVHDDDPERCVGEDTKPSGHRHDPPGSVVLGTRSLGIPTITVKEH